MTSALSGARIRSHNEQLVVALLRDHAPLSRAQLSDRLGLTRAAMSRIVGSMLDRGLLQETGTHSTPGAGRPGTNLELSTRWAGIGLDARADRCELLFLEMGGRILGREVLDMPRRPSPEQFVAALGERLDGFDGGAEHELTGLGVALPGTMSEDRRTVQRSHHFSWDDVPLVDLLEERLGMPVALRHGAECAAIANARLPELATSTRLLHVQIGTGLGLALTRNRDLDETLPVGWGGAGHVLLGDPKRRCICGRLGCVDTVVGFGAFASHGLTAGLHVPPGLDGMYEFAAEVAHRATSGETFAVDMLSDLAAELGRILAVFITIEVPDAVTIGGYPVALGDAFMDQLDDAISSHLLAPSPIVRTTTGRHGAALGAAMAGLSLITAPDPAARG